jgi:hypothetical protein
LSRLETVIDSLLDVEADIAALRDVTERMLEVAEDIPRGMRTLGELADAAREVRQALAELDS